MRFVLDGGSVGSRQALHQTLAAGLHLPEWYGGNLDALHDCLTEPGQPTELVIRHAAALSATLGDYATALHRVLTACAAENPSFTFTWET